MTHLWSQRRPEGGVGPRRGEGLVLDERDVELV